MATIWQPEELLALGALSAASLAGAGLSAWANFEEAPLPVSHQLYTGAELNGFDSLLDPTGRSQVFTSVIEEQPPFLPLRPEAESPSDEEELEDEQVGGENLDGEHHFEYGALAGGAASLALGGGLLNRFH